MNDDIISFLQAQTCATICCLDDAGNPYCFNCYYLFNKDKGLLYFKSSAGANHTEMLAKHPVIAGTILPDKLNKLVTKGIQLQGEILAPAHLLAKDAYLRYHTKFAVALAMKGEVFTISINSIKLTDSSLGFGKKINWIRESLLSVY